MVKHGADPVPGRCSGLGLPKAFVFDGAQLTHEAYRNRYMCMEGPLSLVASRGTRYSARKDEGMSSTPRYST